MYIYIFIKNICIKIYSKEQKVKVPILNSKTISVCHLRLVYNRHKSIYCQYQVSDFHIEYICWIVH